MRGNQPKFAYKVPKTASRVTMGFAHTINPKFCPARGTKIAENSAGQVARPTKIYVAAVPHQCVIINPNLFPMHSKCKSKVYGAQFYDHFPVLIVPKVPTNVEKSKVLDRHVRKFGLRQTLLKK